MARRLGVKEQVAFTGGVAINSGVKRALQEENRLPFAGAVRLSVYWGFGSCAYCQQQIVLEDIEYEYRRIIQLKDFGR